MLFILVPERARTVLNAFFECMYLAELCIWFLTTELSKIPVYFRHIQSKHVRYTYPGFKCPKIPEFLTYVKYFGVSVRFSVIFAKILFIQNQGK